MNINIKKKIITARYVSFRQEKKPFSTNATVQFATDLLENIVYDCLLYLNMLYFMTKHHCKLIISFILFAPSLTRLCGYIGGVIKAQLKCMIRANSAYFCRKFHALINGKNLYISGEWIKEFSSMQYL